MILGHAMEEATGTPWEDLMVEQLFNPLCITQCGFGVPPEPISTAIENPWPHMPSPSGPVPVVPDHYADNPPALGPAGTVHCTMAAYAKFLQLYLDGANGRASPCIISEENFRYLHTACPNQTYTPGGWIREEDEVYGSFLSHAGSNNLNYALAYLFLESAIGFMSMINMGGDAAANVTITTITDLLQERLLP